MGDPTQIASMLRIYFNIYVCTNSFYNRQTAQDSPPQDSSAQDSPAQVSSAQDSPVIVLSAQIFASLSQAQILLGVHQLQDLILKVSRLIAEKLKPKLKLKAKKTSDAGALTETIKYKKNGEPAKKRGRKPKLL